MTTNAYGYSKSETEIEPRLLLRRTSRDTYSTYLGEVEYMRVDIFNDLERVHKKHAAAARASNFDGCGCDYCEAVAPAMPSVETSDNAR